MVALKGPVDSDSLQLDNPNLTWTSDVSGSIQLSRPGFLE